MRSPRKSPDSQRSLFGEILDWMLAPLLFVWPISIAITHYFANSVAAYPYDQALREHVSAIARLVKIENGRVSVAFSGSARAILRADEVDSIYFHVIQRHGRHIAGDPELTIAEDILSQPDEPGETFFRDAEVNGQDLRIAYQYLADPSLTRDRWVVVEVGETLGKRSQLSNKIIASVILPQFIIIPLAVLLVWFGLSQGLKPLTRLRQKIEARRDGDLSEIPTRRVPEELGPLVDVFNAMIERMRSNMAAQQRFIADAAHQLRTPLTGLKTQAQLAAREEDPEALRRALANVAASVDRANRLVTQMLALARAEARDQQQALAPLDVGLLLRDIVGDWIDRAMDRRIDLGLDEVEESDPQLPESFVDGADDDAEEDREGVFGDAVARDDSPMILGNEFLLREMINNLIDNALRYTPQGGRVTCRAVAHGSFVILEVEDNGIGISEVDAENVFERFYRVNDSATEGSGLGLAIVREIAETHRANASLRPVAPERGTVARVVFPRYFEPVEPEEERDPAADSAAAPTGFV